MIRIFFVFKDGTTLIDHLDRNKIVFTYNVYKIYIQVAHFSVFTSYYQPPYTRIIHITLISLSYQMTFYTIIFFLTIVYNNKK